MGGATMKKKRGKYRLVVVRFKDGRVFRRFSSILALGVWLFSKRGQRGRVLGWSAADRALLRRLRLSRTLVRRASDAYVSWVVGTSRIKRM